jgi:hypothetical protein
MRASLGGRALPQSGLPTAFECNLNAHALISRRDFCSAIMPVRRLPSAMHAHGEHVWPEANVRSGAAVAHRLH